jgi:tol-pal system protein YbgF
LILVVIVLTGRYVSIVVLIALFTPNILVAQADIRDASAQQITLSGNTATAEASSVYEIQALQQEVQSLRGSVEEQAYAIKRLKQQRLDDYLDLDKRVSELVRQQQIASAAQNPQNNATIDPLGVAGGSVVVSGPDAVIGNNSDAANTLYNEAISLLLDKQDYDGAKTKFAEYLDRYQGGQYTPNVYYWSGNILFANGEKKAAADNFELLISEYSAHSKVPDAQFKLARIYFDQGKKTEAREILDKVAASNTDAALLAKSFIGKYY